MEVMPKHMRRATILRLVEVMHDAGSWAGETHMQKCVFFMQTLLGVQTGYDFVLYKHGPYSFDLRNELADMMSSLELDVEPHPPYGPSFILGPRGKPDVRLPQRIESAIEFVGENLSTLDTRELERLSTALLLQINNPRWSSQQIASKINEIKPHIPVHDAISAVRSVAGLRAKMADGQNPSVS